MQIENQASVTDQVLSEIGKCGDERLREVASSLVRHLHAFAREVEPDDEEWMAGIRFLTEVGQACQGDRQEFILLSDILGVTMLIDSTNHPAGDGLTDSSVLGPFHRDGAPMLAHPADIAGATDGEACLVRGRVTAPDGVPIEGAVLDIWQTAPNGLYETQDPGQPDFNLRGRIASDGEGRYAFRTVKPVSYPIPTDGPAGRLLADLGRHPYRPGHIHFIVSADGHRPLTTQLFVAGDEYIGSDAVFAVKDMLVADFVECTDAAVGVDWGLAPPFSTVDFDFGLKPDE